MTIHEARLIREVKKRCTYRRLAEVFYPEGEISHGVQLEGQDLCIQALEILYPGENIWSQGIPEKLKNLNFEEDNRSWFGGRIADYYWWE